MESSSDEFDFPDDFHVDLPPISSTFFSTDADFDHDALPLLLQSDESSSTDHQYMQILPDQHSTTATTVEMMNPPEVQLQLQQELQIPDIVQQQSHATNTHHRSRGPTERMMDITLDELSHYFHMPITQASKELKVGLTVLKKRCREFGIPRWPHRKLKSLESLIHNIQELSKDCEGRKNFMEAVRELEDQKKCMEESPGTELSERTKRLRQACFKQSYKQRRQALAKLEADSR